RVAGWSAGFQAMKASGGPGTPSERCVELPGWSGGTVPSSFMFSLFHRWFVERIRGLPSDPEVTIYNCTEGGAFIEGMDHRPLAEVAALLDGEVDVGGELDVAAMRLAGDRSAKIIDHLTGFARGLRRSKHLARSARRLIERGDTGKRLAGVERDLAAALQPLTFVSLLAQREVDAAHDVARRPGSETDYLTASAALFDTLISVIDQLEPTLAAALVRLGARRSRGRAA
ncbi:MAG: hypothetical protein ABIY55_36270, partial [Kofleriaceae bacterium]